MPKANGLPIQGDVQGNWTYLLELVQNYMSEDDTDYYLRMMRDLEADKESPDGPADRVLLGFKRAPAARGNHHAFEGGLVYHYLEMWWVWTHFRVIIQQAFPDAVGEPFFGFDVTDQGYLDDARIIKAIINHDLHKAFYEFRLVSAEPWATEYAKLPDNRLLSSDLRSLFVLQKYKIELDTLQMNMLANAEGGYSDIKTEWASVPSKIAYMLDEFSGNVLGRISSGKWLGHNQTL